MGQIAARRGRGEFFSTSAEETIGLGEALGRVLGPTDVLVLTGDLGAGKTQLTKGVARGMGVTDDVTSPTFTIEMVYEGSRMLGDDRVDVFVSRLDGEVAPGQEPPRSIRLVPRNARGEELLDRLDAELGD